MAKNIIEACVHVSEKAANIARLCREHEHLFPLLIQEKSAEEANPRFVKDFKTLADVLIQETIRHDVGTLVNINYNFCLLFLILENSWPCSTVYMNMCMLVWEKKII